MTGVRALYEATLAERGYQSLDFVALDRDIVTQIGVSTPTIANRQAGASTSEYAASYWVYTPAMDRPLQVYCDQVTDGGGWALVGRGRDSWTFSNFGQGSPATVRTTVDGTGAFAAAALSTDAINGLLDTQALNTLPDGIRVERATNASGTSRQDLRLFPAYAKWTWSIAAGQKRASASMSSERPTEMKKKLSSSPRNARISDSITAR